MKYNQTIAIKDQVDEHDETNHGVKRKKLRMAEYISVDLKANLVLVQCPNIQQASTSKSVKHIWYQQCVAAAVITKGGRADTADLIPSKSSSFIKALDIAVGTDFSSHVKMHLQEKLLAGTDMSFNFISKWSTIMKALDDL